MIVPVCVLFVCIFDTCASVVQKRMSESLGPVVSSSCADWYGY